MEEKQGSIMLRRPAAEAGSGGGTYRKGLAPASVLVEDALPEVARENIVKEMMRIFDSLLGCSPKRTGVKLASIKISKAVPKSEVAKPENGAQRRLEKEIYRLIKELVEIDSPNTGFAVNVLFNNGSYYYDRASVPLSFGVFLKSLVEYLEGHDCLSICPDEMSRLKTLLSRG